MTARWIPSDDDLDKVARSLDRTEPAPDRAEQGRTSLLANAAVQRQPSRRSIAPFVIAGGALAAAAAVMIWIVARPSGEPGRTAKAPKQIVTPIGIARFDRVTDWPDYVVRVDHGKVAVQVAKLEGAERFRVKTADAEVEVRGTKFDVDVDTGRLILVAVHEGRVEIRRGDAQVIVLSAGESWAPTQTAQVIELPPPGHAEPPPSEPAKIESPKRPSRVTPRDKTTTHKIAPADQPRGAPAIPEPPPGEAEFRAAWAALRAGDAAAAAKTFAIACNTAHNDPISEDACFWAGAAAKRAGDSASAKPALETFIAKFPSSVRAPEASALLGWILYDAGDLDGAEKRFTIAAHDRVPKVRDSAERGLEAIKRKRP